MPDPDRDSPDRDSSDRDGTDREDAGGHAARHAEGMAVRRQVLGDEHVDRAQQKTTGFTAPFQDFITRYAWGEVWTGEEASRPQRSCLTLAILAALGCEDEFAMHVRAALRNGVRPEDVREVLMHVAVYAGVPRANRAFALADAVLSEHGAEAPDRR